MKVAVYYNNKDVRIEERPKPTISDGRFCEDESLRDLRN